MKAPFVDSAGLVHYPAGFGASPRARSRRLRIAAATLLLVFGLVVVSTTVVSLGGYCLTSDGGDTRHLPRSTARTE